jgi:hypothetical protein
MPRRGSALARCGVICSGTQERGIEGSLRFQLTQQRFQLRKSLLSQIQFGQTQASGDESQRLGEKVAPVRLGIGELSFIAVEHGQMMTHQRSLQSRIDAAKHAIDLSRDRQGAVFFRPSRDRQGAGFGAGFEQLTPTPACRGTIAALLAQLALEEQQLGIVGTARLAGLAHRPRLLVLAQAAMARGQQRVQFRSNRIYIM